MSETKKRHNVPPPDTHYCDWDAPGGRLVRALCGQLMKRKSHANDPTCPNCRAGLQHRERSAGPA